MARIDEAGTITVRIFGTGRAAVIAPTPQKGRTGCGRCHRWASPGALGGSLLGIEAAYCGACLSELIEACEGRHGRRPLREQEFYCPRCQAIHPLSLLTPSDPNGRRRLICRLCRAEDVAAAGERRAERLKDHDQRSDGDETNETGGDDA